ncbi:MAG: 1-(5-phosphoribosyl)-5-[(5-phosphoribosylamino)methylideneamino] imidazole-4-carboxamide isomerase [Acidimicrobiia bacterium]|nr:1-(5-phosphoribosyl)-5-[(5-phosphoribosylamino)methylideneamino] imidazole-4-carboxamide isomerase [Acidimicrobiia bacterium]
MELYPAIDLRAGRCVRLWQGDFDKETVYGTDPVSVAERFVGAGARWLHVVDLDAARGEGSNLDTVLSISRAVSASVQTGGGVRDDALLIAGVDRVVLGSMAVANRSYAGELIAEYPGRVAIGLDHRDGELRVRGWEEGGDVRLLDAVAWPEFSGAAAFIVTDIGRDGTLAGPDVSGLASVLEATTLDVIASGGVGSLADLEALSSLSAGGRRLAGVIVGKALYEGSFTIEEAMAACAASA